MGGIEGYQGNGMEVFRDVAEGIEGCKIKFGLRCGVLVMEQSN